MIHLDLRLSSKIKVTASQVKADVHMMNNGPYFGYTDAMYVTT